MGIGVVVKSEQELLGRSTFHRMMLDEQQVIE